MGQILTVSALMDGRDRHALYLGTDRNLHAFEVTLVGTVICPESHVDFQYQPSMRGEDLTLTRHGNRIAVKRPG